MSTVDTLRTRAAEVIEPRSRRRKGRMHALTMLVASAGLIVVCLAVAVVSSRFGEDKPYIDDVPDERRKGVGTDDAPPGENIPRPR